MKPLLLAAVLLFFASASPADQVLIGQLTGIPGETVDYNLTVQTTFSKDFGGYVKDLLSGTLLFSDDTGTVFSTWNILNNAYIFGLHDSMILLEFGIYSQTDPPVLIDGYDFVATAHKVRIIFTDPPAPELFSAAEVRSTAEPSTIVLLLAVSLLYGLRRLSFARQRSGDARKGEQ
jgi:hypothetical protein